MAFIQKDKNGKFKIKAKELDNGKPCVVVRMNDGATIVVSEKSLGERGVKEPKGVLNLVLKSVDMIDKGRVAQILNNLLIGFYYK